MPAIARKVAVVAVAEHNMFAVFFDITFGLPVAKIPLLGGLK